MFRQIRSLSYPDKWLLVKVVSLALFIRISLKVIQFKSVIKFIKRFEGKKTSIEHEDDELKRHNYLIILAYSFRPLINCLAICTAFWLLLKRKGIKTELKFGMIMNKKKLHAHAWLEHNGLPLADSTVKEKYTAFSETIL